MPEAKLKKFETFLIGVTVGMVFTIVVFVTCAVIFR